MAQETCYDESFTFNQLTDNRYKPPHQNVGGGTSQKNSFYNPCSSAARVGYLVLVRVLS